MIDQTLEDSYFNFDSLAEQEKDLQKNLVKDVFFSPSIQESVARQAPLQPALSSSCSSSQSGGDDNYSLMSDSLTCASSPSYQYDETVASVVDNAEPNTASFSCRPQPCSATEQFVFPYSLDLYPSVNTTKQNGEQESWISSNKLLPRRKSISMMVTENNYSSKKTVKKPAVKKNISSKTKKQRKPTKKTKSTILRNEAIKFASAKPTNIADALLKTR